MNNWVAWGAVFVFVLLVSVAAGVAVFVRRKRASRVLDPDEPMRQAKLAAVHFAKAARRARQGSMRGGGTAADSDNMTEASRWGGI